MTTLDQVAADYGVSTTEFRKATHYVLLRADRDLHPGDEADVRDAWEQHVADVTADQADREAVTAGAYDVETRTGDDEIDVSDESDGAYDVREFDEDDSEGQRVRVTFTDYFPELVPPVTFAVPVTIEGAFITVTKLIHEYLCTFGAAPTLSVEETQAVIPMSGSIRVSGVTDGRFTVEVVGRDVPVTFYNDEIGFRPGYVPGDCGHAMAGSEWRAGLRKCEHC